MLRLEEIGFKNGIAGNIRDLWNRKDLSSVKDTFKTEVVPHGVVVVKIKGEKAPVSVLKFDQASIELNKGNHRLIQLTVLPSITPVTVTSSNEEVVSLSIAGVNTYRLTAKKEGNCTIKAIASDNNKWITSCKVHVVPSNIPTPWKLDDIKDDKASAVYENGVFTIEGGGSDIWGASDQFAFLNREADSNASISVRIISQTNTDPWAKTGLMFRESTAPGSRFVMISVTPVNGISLQWRENTGESCGKKDFPAVTLPAYLKLSKSGSTFHAFKSADGKNWESLGEVSLKEPFEQKYLAGRQYVT